VSLPENSISPASDVWIVKDLTRVKLDGLASRVAEHDEEYGMIMFENMDCRVTSDQGIFSLIDVDLVYIRFRNVISVVAHNRSHIINNVGCEKTGHNLPILWRGLKQKHYEKH